MSRRWTMKEDLFLHAYFDVVGDRVGTHDLGRPSGAAARRVDYLKRTGAWKALDARVDADLAYHIATGRPNHFDLEELEAGQ